MSAVWDQIWPIATFIGGMWLFFVVTFFSYLEFFKGGLYHAIDALIWALIAVSLWAVIFVRFIAP